MENLLRKAQSFRKTKNSPQPAGALTPYISSNDSSTDSTPAHHESDHRHLSRAQKSTLPNSYQLSNPKRACISNCANIDGLPTDIKLMILESLDNLTDLKSLIHSSPSYHSLQHRALWKWLHINLIGNLFDEAHSLLDARKVSCLPWFLPLEDAANILFRKHRYIPKYHPNRLNGDSRPESVGVETLNHMAMFHQCIEFIASRYIRSAWWQELLIFGPRDETHPASFKNQVYRAFYLLELSYIAVPTEGLWRKGGPPRELGIDDLPCSRPKFFNSFGTPMRRQTYRVFKFVIGEYLAILRRWEGQLNFSFRELKFEKDISIPSVRPRIHLWRCASLGMKFLYDVLNTKDVATQVKLMEAASREVVGRLPRYQREFLSREEDRSER